MKLDFATLAFGYTLKVGGGTPNWSTSLGQNKEYKINDIDNINEILKGIIYKSQSPEKISTKIGKGGKSYFGNADNSPIVIGSVFTKVMINNIEVENGKFILVITRDTSESHLGRLKLKYGPSNTFNDGISSFSNEQFFNLVRKKLNLSNEACWFVSDISIENQDVLKLKVIIVNPNDSVEYQNTEELHKAWRELEPSILELEDNDSPSTQPPQQIIYYGVPGSGKSYKIDEITKNLSEEQKIRVVFHPEYTNADFVGQILPCLTSNGIEYRFKAGPFSRILKKAYQNPNNPHYLIIEEINRGNAAAIFGDLFQLLDRDSEGWSSYKIENLDVNSFIRSKDSTYSDAKIESSVNVGGYTWTENTGIRLPPNLSLLATMNTSDQNVFTLDNAFQRRWDMELVPNSCDDKTQMQAKISVKEKTITWESFQSKINEVIAEKGNESGFSSMEDKRLGCWFIKNNEGKIDPEKFANKVLKYLWDDAFKFNRSEIFIDEVKNFEELKNLFIGDKGFEIFKDINFDFEPQNLEENQES